MRKWTDIQGYEGIYQVSDSGEVMSVKDKFILKQFYTDKGYKRIALCKNGEHKKYFVHRLVARGFVPNSLNKPFVNHVNGMKDDNRAENLEWCTSSENIIHKFSVLGCKYSEETQEKKRQKMLGFKNSETMKAKMKEVAKGEGNNMAKLTEANVIDILTSP